MTRLLLIRHAQTDSTAYTLQGRLPGFPLSRTGEVQALKLQQLLPVELSRIFTSPLERAKETARLFAAKFGITPAVDEAFNELDFGDWAGRSFAELDGLARWKTFNRNRTTAQAPGGESLSQVKKRAVKRLLELLSTCDGETLAIVTHCDVIRAALTHFLCAPLESFERIRIDPASLSEIEYFSNNFSRVARLNHPI